jgi:hypothetical protein
MKKPLIFIIVIVVIAVAAYAATTRRDDSEGMVVTEVEGKIVNIDLEQAMVDGPYVVVVEDEDGADQVIHIPSMGIQLCAARDSIASPSELSLGQEVEAAGLLTPDGILVPCDSTDHYLRAR